MRPLSPVTCQICVIEPISDVGPMSSYIYILSFQYLVLYLILFKKLVSH